MIPTFLDLRTGRTAKGCDESFFWWTEGNGACDCNRAIAFDLLTTGNCLGHKRFVAIDVEGSLVEEGYGGPPVVKTKEECLVALNAEYGK